MRGQTAESLEKEKKIIADFENGMTRKEISEKYKIQSATVSYHLRKHGHRINRIVTKNKEFQEKCVAFYKQGMNFTQIGRELNTSCGVIKKALGNAGVIVETNSDTYDYQYKKKMEEAIKVKKEPKEKPCIVDGKRYIDITDTLFSYEESLSLGEVIESHWN